MYRCKSPHSEFYAFHQRCTGISKVDLYALDAHKKLVLKLLEPYNKMKVFP